MEKTTKYEERSMSKALPLYERARPCLHCGFCCLLTPCGFGRTIPNTGGCEHLVKHGDGTYTCGEYDRIVNGSDESWKIAPAFGAGCCSPMNQMRRDLEKKQK
jgi:hypothetical protein